jgi:hypothetical protein
VPPADVAVVGEIGGVGDRGEPFGDVVGLELVVAHEHGAPAPPGERRHAVVRRRHRRAVVEEVHGFTREDPVPEPLRQVEQAGWIGEEVAVSGGTLGGGRWCRGQECGEGSAECEPCPGTAECEEASSIEIHDERARRRR